MRSASDPRQAPSRQESAIQAAMVVGTVLALIGLIDGIAMLAKRRETECADGTYFPEGTSDFTCYEHPQLGLGIAVIVFSVMLGILVWLAGVAASALVRGADRSESES
ncbi:hypothetical protein [Nocardioides caricicola]|uniref:Uncharacterized protein n=1 Tax=Nocardioides caricicola TaxID=634770 RepID=A0ABW0MZU6_9ACTN